MTIPTLQQLFTDTLADLEAEFGDVTTTEGKSALVALAAVQAGKQKLQYLQLAKVQKNLCWDTAEPEASGGTLERFGRMALDRNPFTATQGVYTCTVTGDAGSVIPAQTTFKSDDDSAAPGYLFILDTAYTMPGSTGSISLRALTPGTDALLETANTLTATAPINNVNSTATVSAVATAPQDAEDLEVYRQKVIEAFRLEPQGGAAADYRLWAADVQGVQQSYPYAKSGVNNEVDLYIEATTSASTDGKGTPTAGILSEVETVIELDPDTTKPLSERGRRPLTVFQVNVQAVTIKEIEITITGATLNGVAITTAQRTLITDALTQFLATVRPFIAGADVLAEKNDVLAVNNIIQIALQTIPGLFLSSVALEVDSTPVTSFTFDDGNIPHLNSVTYA